MEASVVEMWSHNVVDSMTCARDGEGLKRLVLNRGVEGEHTDNDNIHRRCVQQLSVIWP